MSADNKTSKSGLFSATPPMPSATTQPPAVSPTPQSAKASAQTTAMPNGVFGSTPTSVSNTAGPQSHQGQTPGFNSASVNPKSPVGSTTVKPPAVTVPVRSVFPHGISTPWWSTRQGQTGMGICATLALLLPLCYFLFRPSPQAPGVTPPLPVERPVPPITAEAKAQIRQIRAILNSTSDWLNQRYAKPDYHNLKSEEVSTNVLSVLNTQSAAQCPADFQVAFDTYVSKCKAACRYETQLADFYRNAGSGLSKTIAAVESGASQHTGIGANPIADIHQEENQLISNIRTSPTAINAAQEQVDQLATHYSVSR